MSNLSRRQFIRNSIAVAGGAVALTRGRAAMGANGANDRIRVAIAGLHGRGDSHVDEYLRMKDKNVEIAWLIDPDARLFEPRCKTIESKGCPRPQLAQDVRKALDDKNVDVISIATPNHWHSLMTIWACEAGKDVYVEKPMSHNIHEGRVAVETARKHKRIVQHGTQSRSDMKWAKIVAAIASGKLGKLKVSRGLCYKSNGRGSIGFKPHKMPPNELDFNLWLGPAPTQPYHENLVHYNWHWFWDFGNGDLGNQGVHQMDIARWAIPGATLPKSVISLGGRLGYYDQAEVASSQIVFCDYGETKLIFEVRGLPSEKYRGQGVGNIFHLEAGTIVGDKFYPNDGKTEAPLPDVEATRGPGDGNFGNFIAAVRSRDIKDLNAYVLEGHLSSALCHLGNMSHRLGHKVPFKPRTPEIAGNDVVCEALDRMEEYLAKNDMKIDESGYTLGRPLTVDAETESIVDDPQANELLTRDYRKGFVVPEHA